MISFKELDVKDFILEAVKDLNFQSLTEVQAQVLPQALEGANLIVQSQTGTGKTHAFLMPIFQQVDPHVNRVQAVITAPSRELADQLYKNALHMASFSPEPIRVARYIGGTDKQRQIDKLRPHKQPQIVVGTPGRIFDLMSAHVLFIQDAKILVVDEGDMTLDLGFLPILDEIASRMPVDLQMMVFSATIPQALQVFLRKYTQAVQTITIQPKHVISPYIDNYLIQVPQEKKIDQVYRLLTLGHPYLAVVFCNTKEEVDQVHLALTDRGLEVGKIHGGISSRDRKKLMRQIRDLKFQYIVATDLAARGIDIPGISLVINMDLPTDLDYFVHRVGRTGRNQVPGQAFTLVTPGDTGDLDRLKDRGIEFTPVQIKQGDLVPDRGRADRKRQTTETQEDPEIKRMVNQTRKKKVKPGYKRKLGWEIKEHRRRQSKLKRRQAQRDRRRARIQKKG